jgi:murein tripeptide amidase MpaA
MNSDSPGSNPSSSQFVLDHSRFLRYKPLCAALRDLCTALPNLFSLESIGKSHEGREIWVVIATNRNTGEHTTKPALWIDGNIHAAELTASTACLYYLQHLALGYGKDPQITHLLDTSTVYVCPRLNPDGAELALADKPRHIRSSTRPYPFDHEPVEGLTIEDVDGDGRVLSMRIKDPNGTYKCHPDDARLMVPREPEDISGSFYRLMPEGTLINFDGFTVKVNKDKEGLDLNRNFPAFWRQEHEQVGAGPYPTSEPEVRAMVHFITHRPNIGAAVSFHTHSGVILRPMGTQADNDMIPEDLWLYQKMSAKGTELTGYPAISIFHEFKYHPKEHISGTQDWVYEHLGSLFWTVEIWSPNAEAGITGYKWIDWYRDHPAEDDLKLLKWSDEKCGGQAYAAWRPFRHPQLGEIEIGGWDRMNFWRNPPPELREREAARFPAWLIYIGLTLPRLQILNTEVQPLGVDTWRIRFAVCNAGYLPSYVSKRALERKQCRGVVFELELGDDASLILGKPRTEGPHLEGHAPKASLQAFLPNNNVTGDRAVCEWVVKGKVGASLGLKATADRAGSVATTIVLDLADNMSR